MTTSISHTNFNFLSVQTCDNNQAIPYYWQYLNEGLAVDHDQDLNNIADWVDEIASTDWAWFRRGYTGHEMLPEFGLINMNGRAYDPVLGRMLQVDNYVQNPFSSQSYNRYSYVWNNPLKYVDPDGEFLVLSAALFSGVMNLATQAANNEINNFWDGVEAFGAGAISGGVLASISVFGTGPSILTSLNTQTNAINTVSTIVGVGAGLYDGIINGNWERLRNGGRLFAGKYYLNSDTNFFDQTIEGISRGSWETLQSTAGYNYSQYRNAFGAIDRVDYFGGSTFSTNQNQNVVWGISLGNFINVSIRDEINGTFRDRLLDDFLYMHEFGHKFDSKRYGLSYLGVIGISSMRFALGRTNNDWTEVRADQHAARYFERFGVDWPDFE